LDDDRWWVGGVDQDWEGVGVMARLMDEYHSCIIITVIPHHHLSSSSSPSILILITIVITITIVIAIIHSVSPSPANPIHHPPNRDEERWRVA
jgi:hypothetical protein